MKRIYLAVKDGKGWVGGSKQELVSQIAEVTFLNKYAVIQIENYKPFELNYLSDAEDKENGFSASEMVTDVYKTVFEKLAEYGYFLK